jgi:hypothetical protein
MQIPPEFSLLRRFVPAPPMDALQNSLQQTAAAGRRYRHAFMLNVNECII